MTASTLGGNVGAQHLDREIGVDCRYPRRAGGITNDDPLTARNEDSQVRVRVQPRAGAADLDAIPLPARVVARVIISPGTVVADVDVRVIPAPKLRIHDMVRRVDHAQRLMTTDIALLDAKPVGVSATAR